MTVTSHSPAEAADGVLGVAVDLDAVQAHLDAVVRELGAPPADRNAALWAAHELATCAQLLVRSRAGSGHDGAADLAGAMDYARSAMGSLAIARRQDPALTDGWSPPRS